MENLLKIPYTVFNDDWDLLQQFLERRGNPRYELVGDVDLYERKNIFDLGNLVRVDGDLDLFESSIQSLGALEYVSGNLGLYITKIKSLENLKYVGGDLNLSFSSVQSLGNLVRVDGLLILQHTSIESLGNLEYIGNEIIVSRNHQIPDEQLTRFKFKIFY